MVWTHKERFKCGTDPEDRRPRLFLGREAGQLEVGQRLDRAAQAEKLLEKLGVLRGCCGRSLPLCPFSVFVSLFFFSLSLSLSPPLSFCVSCFFSVSFSFFFCLSLSVSLCPLSPSPAPPPSRRLALLLWGDAFCCSDCCRALVSCLGRPTGILADSGILPHLKLSTGTYPPWLVFCGQSKPALHGWSSLGDLPFV